MRELAAKGVAVIIISSEFEEILAVADRVLVMRDGKVVASRAVAEIDDHELMLLASGISGEVSHTPAASQNDKGAGHA